MNSVLRAAPGGKVPLMSWCTFLVGIPAMFVLAHGPAGETIERLLRDPTVPTEEALRFFRERTLSAEDVAALKNTLQQLGSPSFTVRQRAADQLVRAGLSVRAMLMEAVQDPATDLEIARRAQLC